MKKLASILCSVAIIIGVMSSFLMTTLALAIKGVPIAVNSGPYVAYNAYWGHIDSTKPPVLKNPDVFVEEGGNKKIGYLNSPGEANMQWWAAAFRLFPKGTNEGSKKDNIILNDEGGGIFGKADNPIDAPLYLDEAKKEYEYFTYSIQMRTVAGASVKLRPVLVLQISGTGNSYEFPWIDGNDGTVTVNSAEWKTFGGDGKTFNGYFDVTQKDFEALWAKVKTAKASNPDAKAGYCIRWYNVDDKEAWVEIKDYDTYRAVLDGKVGANKSGPTRPNISTGDSTGGTGTSSTPGTSSGTSSPNASSDPVSSDSSDSSQGDTDKVATKIISGTVLDGAGTAVSGATVKFGDTEKTTDSKGKFTFTSVPVGEHKLTITKDGNVLGEDTYKVEFGTKAALENKTIITDSVGAVLKLTVDKRTIKAEIDVAATEQQKKDNPTNGTDNSSTGSLLWLWCTLGGIVVLGGLFCLYWFVLRPKMAAKKDGLEENNNTQE